MAGSFMRANPGPRPAAIRWLGWLRFLLIIPIFTALRRNWRTSLTWRLGISHLVTVFLAASAMFVIVWIGALVYTFMLGPAEKEPADDARAVAQALESAPDATSEETSQEALGIALGALARRDVRVDRTDNFNFTFAYPQRLEHVRSISLVGPAGTIIASSEPGLNGRPVSDISAQAQEAFNRAVAGSTDLKANSILKESGESAAVGAYPLLSRGSVVVVDKEDLMNERGMALLLDALTQFFLSVGVSLLVISIPATAVAAVIAIPLARTVVRPVKSLGDAVQGIASGDLARRAPADREDEVGSLAKSFNSMAADLQQTIWLEAAERARAEERTRELSTLLDVSANVAATLELKQLLGLILDQLKVAIDYSGAAIVALDGDELVIQEERSRRVSRGERYGPRFPVRAMGISPQLLAEGHPIIVADIRSENDPFARRFRETVGTIHEGRFTDTRSWMGIPLLLKDQPLGLLALSSDTPGFFTTRDAEFAATIANQAAVAMENARLFAEAERRAHEMEALSRAASVLSVERTMSGTLDSLAERVVASTGAVAASVSLVDRLGRPTVSGQHGLPPGMLEGFNAVINRGIETPNRQVVLTRETRVIPTAREAALEHPDYVSLYPMLREVKWDALVIVPMISGTRVIGTVEAYYPREASPDQREQGLIFAMAAQAAVAVENVRLFTETELRAREMETLSRIAANVNFDQPLATTLDRIAERVVESSHAVACSIGLVGQDLRYSALGCFGLPEGYPEMLSAMVAAGTPTSGLRAFRSGATVITRDLKKTLPDTPEYAPMHAFIGLEAWDTIVALPLFHRGRPLGTVQLYYLPDEEPDEHELTFVTAIANQTAVALENARLFAQTERRVRELEAIARIGSNFTFAQSIDEMMVSLADQVVQASSALGCTVTLVEEPDQRLRILAAAGFPDGFAEAMEDAYAAGAPSTTISKLATGEVQLIRDARRQLLVDERYAVARALVDDVPWDTLLGIPIVYRGVGLGMLAAAYAADTEPDEAEISFLQAIGDQAAIAIENARLFNRASSLAALQERQRLARELHDSVSQALYGIALGAKTARRRLESDPEKVAEPLDYVLSLTEAGLTEMRALIFELRPESLAEEGLVAAITRQAAALRARYGIEVEADLCDEPEIELRTKEALYRIAQEALHNTVKHARASHINVSLRREDGRLLIDIRDNGQGFNTDGDFPGHLGLRSMRERVGAVGGAVEVSSGHGEGTHVRAWVPI